MYYKTKTFITPKQEAIFITQQVIHEKRKKFLLYILDVILFAFVITAFSWTFEVYLLKEWAQPILILAIYASLIAVVIAFKLIISPTRIHERIPCILIQDRRTGAIIEFLPELYQFSFTASDAFSRITEEFPEYKEKLKHTLGLDDKLLEDFNLFAIIKWLKQSTFVVIRFSSWGRSPPAAILDGKSQVYSLKKETIDQNLFLKSIKTRGALKFPEKTKIQVKNGEVTLDYKLMRITVSLMFWQSGGLSRQMQFLLHVPEKDLDNYWTLGGIVEFDAKFKLRSIFCRRPDKYYNYSKALLDNLRYNFSYSEFMENIKEVLFWGHMMKK